MLKTRLLQAVCTVAMLAAVPAFAQSNTPPAGSGSGTGAPMAEESHSTHHSTKAHRSGTMHSAKSAASQDAAVDRLNEQSYQAAQKGEAFNGGGSDKDSGGMTYPGGSGSMNDMPGGAMPGGGATDQGTKP